MRYCLLICALCLTACAEQRPDLARLYPAQMDGSVTPTPVIVIPGILGSRLTDSASGREVWPGPWYKLLTSEYPELALEIDPDTLEPLPSSLVASGITEGALGRDFYGQLLRTLEHYGGYAQAVPGEAVETLERRYYVFAYDWRQDNVRAAAALDDLIEQIRRDYGKPDLKVDIVAHSMGGLIARYWLRYGKTDVLDDRVLRDIDQVYGRDKLRRLVMLGTPNLGSIGALHSFLHGFKVVDHIPTEVVATMPSGYQLFPHPLSEWIITAGGKPLKRDLYDRKVWQAFQWSIFAPTVRDRIKQSTGESAAAYLDTLERYFEKRLERARRFVWSLTTRLPDTPVRHVVFGGDCTLTPARLVVEEVNGESIERRFPSEIQRPEPGVDYGALMLEPGDGRVTRPSLLARTRLDPGVQRHRYISFPLAYSFFLCEDHDRLTGNINFQNNLLNVLLSASLPWEEENMMQTAP